MGRLWSLLSLRLSSSLLNQDEKRSRFSCKPVENCSLSGRRSSSIVAALDGTLTKSRSPFAYFMLLAYEGGSPIRGLLLLLLYPFISFVHRFVSPQIGIRCLIFVSLVGQKVCHVSQVARTVLPKFYLEDLHPKSFSLFKACDQRYVVTSIPRIMVEPFLKEYLGVKRVMGTELQVVGGYCTGLVSKEGIMAGVQKREAIERLDHVMDIGIGMHRSHMPFLGACKEAFFVSNAKEEGYVARDEYLKPLISHDGRLAMRPTPSGSLLIFLWWPMGFMLAILRIMVASFLPYKIGIMAFALLGVRIRKQGESSSSSSNGNSLYVCMHRTLLDPLFVSATLGHGKMIVVTYNLSPISILVLPMKMVCLSQNREQDTVTLPALLKQDDLIIFPEGATCQEPHLLQFSSLFAEVTDNICPVAINIDVSMFHGSTTSGFKAFDPLYFFMNPYPSYVITFLEPLPKNRSFSAGNSSLDVANYVQKQITNFLGYGCTNLTSKDKCQSLVGNDGIA